MVSGLNIKCKNCFNRCWIEINLKFGARQNENNEDLLDCLLSEVRFYFKCPYCKQDTIVSTIFFANKPPEIAQIVENPHYIG